MNIDKDTRDVFTDVIVEIKQKLGIKPKSFAKHVRGKKFEASNEVTAYKKNFYSFDPFEFDGSSLTTKKVQGSNVVTVKHDMEVVNDRNRRSQPLYVYVREFGNSILELIDEIDQDSKLAERVAKLEEENEKLTKLIKELKELVS